MKSEAAFIPDNISAISNVSRHHIFPNPSHEFTQLQSESTDNLVEEILRQRAERLKKQQYPIQQAIQTEKNEIQPQATQDKPFQSNHDNKSQQKIELPETKQLNTSKQAQEMTEKLINHSNGTIKQSSIKEKESTNKIEIQDHLEVLNNQTNKFSVNDIEQNAEKDQADNTQNKFILPNIDRFSRESAEIEKQNHSREEEKSLKLNLSMSPSQKNQNEDQNHVQKDHQSTNKIDIGQKSIDQRSKQEDLSQQKIQKSIRKEQTIKDKSIESQRSRDQFNPSNNTTNQVLRQEIGNGESQIQVKHSQMQSEHHTPQEKTGAYDFIAVPKKSQTDLQVVQAITEHLNTIENEQISQKTFRFSEKNIILPAPVAPIPAQSKDKPESKTQVQQINKQPHFQQFETDYSQNNRQVKILEHRWQSNLQFQIGQLKEMIDLYQALILNEECRQTRKEIKQLELRNRRQKIALRAASYTKRFNFHSPIEKNNSRPIQFRKKFVISPKFKDQFHQIKQNIADQKKKQVDLEEEFKVLCDYYEMMKQKKITVYQQGLKQFQYNSKLEKYQTVKNGFFKKTSLNFIKESPQKFHSQYQFDKTKRTIEIENSTVPYYQVLKFKIDISKDMMLQFEVWNLSKIKKLRDQNLILKKEIQYVNQLISQVDAQFAKLFGIKTVKSLSRSKLSSPNSFRLTDTSPVKSLTKSPMRQLRRPNTGCSTSQKISLNVSSSNGLKSVQAPNTPTKQNLPKKDDNSNNQLLLIDSVQLDYSKKKAIRILDQMDDYGIVPIKQQSKVFEDIPTFGKKQNKRLMTSPIKELPRSKSKNFVKPRSREIKTMTNLDKRERSVKKIGKVSEQTSPVKTNSIKSEYYTSMDDLISKGE